MNTPVDSILSTSQMPPPNSLRSPNGVNASNTFKSPKSPKRSVNTRRISCNNASPGLPVSTATSHDSESMNAASALTSLFHSPGYNRGQSLRHLSTANSTPTATATPTHTSTPTNTQHPDEADAQLMLFLATSPSPAKPDKHKSNAYNKLNNVDLAQWIQSPHTNTRN